MSESEIFHKGLKLTIRKPDETVQTYALNYQWLDFSNRPKLLNEPVQLLLADDCISFRHVVLYKPRPSDNVTDLTISFQSNKAMGVVLISDRNELPDLQLKPSASDSVTIPVVLISRRQGERLLQDVQDSENTVHVVFTRETSTDSKSDYQTPPKMVVDEHHPLDETTRNVPGSRPDYTGSNQLNLAARIKELVFHSATKQPLLVSNDSVRFISSFTLLDRYEQLISQRRVRNNVKETLHKVCNYLTTCMENAFAEDFPYYCTTAFRLQRLVADRQVSNSAASVVHYHQLCVKRLRTLTRLSVQNVFLPFLRTNLMLPISGEQRSATDLLRRFVEDIVASYPKKSNSAAGDSVENFGIAVIAGAMLLVIQQNLPDTRPPNIKFWESLIEKINSDLLPWSEELLLELKSRLEQASYMELDPQVTFDCNSLDRFIRRYRLISFDAVWQTIRLLWPVLPDKQRTWHVTSGLTRIYLEERINHSGVLLSSVCDAGTVESLCENALKLILAIKDLQELGDIENGSDVKGREIRNWIKFVLTSRFLGVEHDKWVACIAILRRDVEAPFDKLVWEEAIEIVNESISQLKATTLFNLIQKLHFLPEEVVSKFLKSHKRRKGEKLKDSVWFKLFREIELRAWNSLKADIVDFLERFSSPHNSSPSDRMHFCTDLIDLAQRCPRLLTCEDKDLLYKLTVFLLDYLKPSKALMQERVQDILSVDADQNHLTQALLDVVFQVIIPVEEDLLNWQRSRCVDTLLIKISTEVTTAGKESRRSAHSNRSATYEKLLVECCRRIPHSKFTLSNPPNVAQLAAILVALDTATDGSLATSQTAIEVSLTKEMEEYRQWFENVRDWLSEIQRRFSNDQITVIELQDYERNYDKIKVLYESFICPAWLLPLKDVKHAIGALKSAAMKLNSHLFFPMTGCKRGKVKDVLVAKNVAVDEDLFQSVDRRLSLIEQPKDNHDTVCLSFKPTVTCAQAKEIHDLVSKYLEPIMNNKNLLCYFYSHGSVLFEAFLENELKTLRDSFSLQHEAHTQATERLRSAGTTQRKTARSSVAVFVSEASDSGEDAEQEICLKVTLQELNDSLEHAQKCLLRLLDRAVVFRDLTVIGQDKLTYVNLDAEISTIVAFPDFKVRYDAESVRRGVRDILSLFQYSAVIQMIVGVCEKYLSASCFQDPCFVELKRRGEELRNSSHMDQLTHNQHIDLKATVDKLLSSTPVERLRLFDAVEPSDEFFKFVRRNKFYSPEGKASFRQQVQLITNQLQEQEYDETVLSHLQVAFQCIVPFTDPDITFTNLLVKLNESDIFDMEQWFHPLRTVNGNITMIKAWFSKAEGDTIENVTRDLEAILTTGFYEFMLGSSATASTEKRLTVSPESVDDCHFRLRYTVQSNDAAQQPTLSSELLVGERALVPTTSLRQRRCLQVSAERWDQSLKEQVVAAEDVGQQIVMSSLRVPQVHRNDVDVNRQPKMLGGEELDDFLLKLRFVLNEQRDEQQLRMRNLLTKTEILNEMFQVCSKLHRLGHPIFRGKQKSYSISSASNSVKDKLKKFLSVWETSITKMHKTYPQLLLFNIQQTVALAEALRHGKTTDVINIISVLFSNSHGSFAVLESKVRQHFSRALALEQEAVSPFQLCGEFLQTLVNDEDVGDHLYPHRRLGDCNQRGHFVHFSSVFTPDQVLRLILQIYGGLPESFELMRCTSNTSLEELEIFLGRTQVMENRTFLIVNVDELSTGPQELVLRFQLNCSMSQSVHVHYITTGSAVLHDVPWIEVKQYKEHEPTELSADRAIDMYKTEVLEATGIPKFELVFGRAGDGKSHYIRKQMKMAQGDACTIAVHEAFSVQGAITKMQQLNLQQGNLLYFNVTLSPPNDQNTAEADRYQKVMSKLNWFLFDLFVLGYVQDPNTGQSFRIRGGCGWSVYVEVPSIVSEDDDGRKALNYFLGVVPILTYIGSWHHIAPRSPFEINADAQLVCKYLRALKNPSHINRLCHRDKPVKFSTDPEVEDSECQRLLLEVMDDHVKDRKIMQQLFVKYMKKRCDILETAPGFNFNIGEGEYFEDKRTGKKRLTNTRELGSTLLGTMLKEVNSFCHPDIQNDWKLHSHQQLVYDFKGGLPTFQYLSLNPEKLDRAQRENLEKIGIKIPTPTDLNDRLLLDRYLASALDLDLEESPTSGNAAGQKRLLVIDEEQYVLTADYAVKMLAIHERRMCGVPVIIEGETGVGKTALVQMLSLLWNESLTKSRRIALARIYELLQTKTCAGLQSSSHSEEWYVDAANCLASCISSKTKPDSEVVNRVCALKWKDIKNFLLTVVDKPSMYLFDVDRKLVAKARDENTPEVTARLLEAFLIAKPLQTFHKLSVHSALTPEDISEFFHPIFDQAQELQQLATECGEKQLPTVVVLLDEINTSSFMGLVKELIVDRSLESKPIPSNVFLVAACNPHRGCSISSQNYDDWVWGSYYVRPLPPTLHYLKWDYGALDEPEEYSYIQEKIAMSQTTREVNRRVLQYSSLIAKCQSLMREFASRQLQQVQFSNTEAKTRAKSCVSQRDIQRVFNLAAYFEKFYRNYFPDRSHDSITRRAFLVSMGVVYYLRLDDKYRKEFCRQLDSVEGEDTEFMEVFTEEIDFYAKKMHIPVGIAQTRALKENVFATIVCTACHLPLIIVGPPGSSKTLSFNLVLLNLKGAESRQSFFRTTDQLPALDPYHYQCSRQSTSLEIKNVFNRAIKRQLHYKKAKLPISCVVFMDEAGLPEESHESLKVLHYYLDNPRIAFVAITNHILDAAKSNRAISLFTPVANEEDLKTLTRGCLCKDPSSPTAEMLNIIGVVDRFCSSYAMLVDKGSAFEKFFGLRDFIHFIGYIRRHRGSSTELTPSLVLKALERNFNGVEKTDFQKIAKMFLSEMTAPLPSDLNKRNTVEVLRESLADLSLAQSGDNDGIEAEVRYKLIIDTSKDDSMARLLFRHGVLDQKLTRTFTCTDFPGDGDTQKVHVIAAIKHAAMEGRTVILRQTDDINESFYDLFNQHFRRIDDPRFEGGRRYYANIAVGSHSKPCRVDPKFQCIVHMRQQEVNDAPAPFLNRFEKFLVSQDDLLQIAFAALPPCVRNIVTLAMNKVESFQEAIGIQHFYGATTHTLESVILELLPPCGEKETNMYERLDKLVKPENDSDDTEDDDEGKPAYRSLDGSWQQQASKILENLEHVIQTCLRFRFSKRTATERQFQANAIFSAVLQLFEKADGRACRQQLVENSKRIQYWLAEGLLDLLRSDETKRTNNHWGQRISRNASFGVSALVQWLVFHVCSSLLKITLPESLILKRGHIPSDYLLEYLNQQPHFSLKGVVTRVLRGLSSASSTALVSKLICFTRTTSVLHSLPSNYRHGTIKYADSQAVQFVKQLLPEGFTYELLMFKLETVNTLEDFTNILKDYMEDDANGVLLIIANMRSCSERRINHVRAMIEEYELSSYAKNGCGKTKHFILLLHFPPSLGYTKPCYPTLFLHGWEHIYLDSIAAGMRTDPVDVRQWMRMSCVPVEKIDQRIASNCVSEQIDHFSTQLMECLMQLLPHAINVAVSRVLFGDNNDKCHLNRKMDAKTRADLLLRLLNTVPNLSKALCRKFAIAWDVSSVAEQLLTAAHSQMEQDSCLTVSDRVQSRFRTLFYNYVSLSLFQLNKDYNLEILFEQFDSENEKLAVTTLFVEIFKTLPIPQLNELRHQNHTFDARQQLHQWLQIPSIFPFFSLVSQEIEQVLDEMLIRHKQQVISSTLDTDHEATLEHKQESLTCIRQRDIESEVAKRLVQILRAPEEKEARSSLAVARLACQVICENNKLWERYLADFLRVQLHCFLGHYTSQEHRLLSAWLGQSRGECRVVQLHMTVRLRQKEVLAIITALKLLQTLKTLHPEANSFDVGVVTEPGHFNEGQLCIYIINVMYDCLEVMLSKPSGSEDRLLKWCCVYSNLKSFIEQSCFNDAIHQSKFQAIHVVNVFVRSVRLERSTCAVAMKFAQIVCKMARKNDGTVEGLPLGSVINGGLACMHQAIETNVNGGTTDDFLTSCRNFVEDVLALYFSSVTIGSELCSSSSKSFCWLLKMIDGQDQWVSNEKQSRKDVGTSRSSVPLQEKPVSAGDSVPVGLVPFGVLQQCLTRILQTGANVDPRTGLSRYVRRKIGEALCEHCSRRDLEPYILACYPKESTSAHSLQQPLATVYFHCCLTSFSAKLGKAAFVNLLSRLDECDLDMKSAEMRDLAVLQIERQAIVQIVISNFSHMFEPGSANCLKPILNPHVIPQVNSLFNEQEWGGGDGGGHIFAFLHHLSRHLLSVQDLVTLFTDCSDTHCEPFPWMQPLSEDLLEKPRVEAHLFPFMLSNCSVQTSQTALYEQISRLVGDIAVAAKRGHQNDESAAVDVLCEFCRETRLGEGNVMHLRMVLWLAVYYQLYEKKIESSRLADAVCALDCLELDEKQGKLLRCFAVPQTMEQCCKVDRAFNPEVRLDTRGSPVIRRTQSMQTKERDPLWDLFSPSQIDGQDQSDIDLRRALALLAAVAMSLPTHSTHLWTHLFEPTAIEKTLATGNTSRKRDGLLYDCGCELTTDGGYGQTDYAAHARRTQNHHSLHFLLWVNFGGFCLSLLTQPGVEDIIKGLVLPKTQSVRHYCLDQLKKIWKLMRNSMNFFDEERTLFVTTVLHKFFEVAQQQQSPLRGAMSTNPQDLDSYERVFHVEVFQPTLEQFRDKTLVNERIWQRHPLLTSLRTFSETYYTEPTFNDFMYSLENVQADELSQLSVLCKFLTQRQCLRIGGLLLPDLVEFYVWLHQQLSHLITRRQACDLSVSDVVQRLTNRYSKRYADRIRSLFSRVQENYNKCLELTGSDVGQGSGLRVRSQNKLQKLQKSTKLVQLLSYSEEDGVCSDALFAVIRNLVKSQNDFVGSVSTTDNVTVSPLELRRHNCLMGDVTQDEQRKEMETLCDDSEAELMSIIRKHYLYVPTICSSEEVGMTAPHLPANASAKDDLKAMPSFDFRRLQKDVVTHFITGKPFVSDPAQIRVVFRYREELELRPSLKSSDNVDAHVDLSTLRQELPGEFQDELPAARKKQLDVVFHDLNYRDSVDVIKALRAVAGHLCQAIMEMADKDKETISVKCRELSKQTVCDFVQIVFNETKWSQELGSRIGFPRFVDAPAQREELVRTPLSQLYKTLASFYSKLCNGEYEFAHLPLTLKTSLSEVNTAAINKIPSAYAAKGRKSALVQGLKQFDQTLLHSERAFEKEAKKSLSAYLVDIGYCGYGDLPVCCLPEDIRVEHYMYIRLAIQRVLREVLAADNVTLDNAEICPWSDVVTSLLDEFPQLEHRLTPDFKSLGTKLPVFVLGGEGGLHHPLWFEENGHLSNDDQSVDSSEDEDDSGLHQLREVQTSTGLDDLKLYSTEERRQDSTKTHPALFTKFDGPDTRCPIKEEDSEKAGAQNGGNEADSTLTLRAEPQSPLTADEVFRTMSPEDKKFLIQRLQSETEKELDYMSIDDVSRFLEVSGFSKYVDAFREGEIDGYELQGCGKEELKALGVAPLDRNKILKAIQRERKK